jgi:hypothetical protein
VALQQQESCATVRIVTIVCWSQVRLEGGGEEEEREEIEWGGDLVFFTVTAPWLAIGRNFYTKGILPFFLAELASPQQRSLHCYPRTCIRGTSGSETQNPQPNLQGPHHADESSHNATLLQIWDSSRSPRVLDALWA